ncbi:beta-glucan synthesis-associated protein-domain-containing protein [Flammula alnicola]|nr:beta-glucan synthesis-associated protein-domain-containing protein [Flammula alnicola]
MSSRRFTASSSESRSSLLLPSERGGSGSVSGRSGVGSLNGSVQSVSRSASGKHSIAEKYSLGPEPALWGMPLNVREDDDALHDPRVNSGNGHLLTVRALTNLGSLVPLTRMFHFLSSAGYPIISHFLAKKPSTQGGFNLGGINASGQIPEFSNFGLIDPVTPKEAYTRSAFLDSTQDMVLVFSDEFETDGRTFYPGDDPFWEAVDLHYWGTVDLEWYDPMQATTSNGSLKLRIDKVTDPADNHNLQYRSGMIQSWNKFCFTGGILEANVVLPGSSTISGLWPAVWSMGNLGRAGYGASLDGMWPFSYDSCDVGTLPNQTFPGTTTPLAATENGDPTYGGVLSFLPGQKLSACTCSGESHPGPQRSDGSYVGRAAPEIDVFEAIITAGIGQASLSAQWAPYNAAYEFNNATGNVVFQDNGTTIHNPFVGGAFQQTTSGLATTNQNCYELNQGCFAVYAFEYRTGFDDGYISWIQNGQLSWTLRGPAMGPDSATEISTRPIPLEPMYIIANLGLSLGFGVVDFENLIFPATMSIDYIRVYQPANAINIGCDPKDFPTANYIDTRLLQAIQQHQATLFTTYDGIVNPIQDILPRDIKWISIQSDSGVELPTLDVVEPPPRGSPSPSSEPLDDTYSQVSADQQLGWRQAMAAKKNVALMEVSPKVKEAPVLTPVLFRLARLHIKVTDHHSSTPSSNGGFFRDASGFSIDRSMLTEVRGNMIIVRSPEQQSLWNSYRLTDFDQRTLRCLRSIEPGIYTMEMEPMTSTSRIKIYRIHEYGDKEDIFHDHLAIVKSSQARRPDISQFFGTSVENADGSRFIVLSGGNSPLMDVFTGSSIDIRMITAQHYLQIIDIFSIGSFSPLNWSWVKFWHLPIFTPDCRLLVDLILLESNGMLASSERVREMAFKRPCIVRYREAIYRLISPGDMECIVHRNQDPAKVKDAIVRADRASSGLVSH